MPPVAENRSAISTDILAVKKATNDVSSSTNNNNIYSCYCPKDYHLPPLPLLLDTTDMNGTFTNNYQINTDVATNTTSSQIERECGNASAAAVGAVEEQSGDGRGSPFQRRHRKNTTIDSAIHHPGNVIINVEGAFIVDEEPGSPPKPGIHSDGTKDIRLPHQFGDVSHIAVDIGGSLAKVVYFTRDPSDEGGRLNFTNFETDNIDDCISYMKFLIDGQRTASRRKTDLCVMATGGGAYKYYDKIRENLGVEVHREDEMECLIVGLDFFITEIPEEVFTYSENDPMHFAEARPDIYPYLLVNIGSGVSMIKVSGPQRFERIGGSSLGGGTLWGLLSLLTGARSFDNMLHMADQGDNTAVDMLVGDIYGRDYGSIGLKATTIASSFGKVFKKNEALQKQREKAMAEGIEIEEYEHRNGPESIKNFKPEDISRSLLYAVSNNIGQIAYLQAQKHNLEHIYFGGSFIRGHRQTINTLSYAIKFWSNGEKKAYFLRHEGYLGSVGAFMRRQPMVRFRRFSDNSYIPTVKAPGGEIADGRPFQDGDRSKDRRGSVF